jgi:hypothetical protein
MNRHILMILNRLRVVPTNDRKIYFLCMNKSPNYLKQNYNIDNRLKIFPTPAKEDA